jgi:uncharacterized Tic20 family protein
LQRRDRLGGGVAASVPSVPVTNDERNPMTTTPPGTPQHSDYAAAGTRALSPADERLWATLIHVGGIVVGWVAPLLGYLLLRDRGVFVREHAATALNFQLTLFIGVLVGWVLSIVGIGLLILLAVFAVNVVFGIIAAMKAHQGAEYVYPVAIRFVR